MTRQAVCEAGNLFFRLLHMAVQAPAHVHPHPRFCDRHLTNVTVTGFTALACPQMSLMAEKDELRLMVYSLPWDRLTALPETGQHLNSFILGCDEGVAAYAFLHGRYPGNVGTGCTGMAEQTLYPCIHVRLVTVCDGLYGGSSHLSTGKYDACNQTGNDDQGGDYDPACHAI